MVTGDLRFYEYDDKSKNDAFQHSKRTGEMKYAQGSATLECARRPLPHGHLGIVLVGGTEAT